MKYDISNNHGHIPWMKLTAETPEDKKQLNQLAIDLSANKAHFNSHEFGGGIELISFQITGEIEGK